VHQNSGFAALLQRLARVCPQIRATRQSRSFLMDESNPFSVERHVRDNICSVEAESFM
jgi:hypothetical protein